MMIVSILLTIIAIYLGAGLIFAIPFILRGVNRIDEGAHGATWGFRVIIIPGTMVFWPILLKKWIRASKQERI